MSEFLASLRRILADTQQILTTPLVQLGGLKITLLSVLAVVIGLLIVRLLAQLARRLVLRAFAARGRDRRSAAAISRLAELTVLFIGILVVLDTVGVQISAFVAAFAALGVGIGFGLQNLANNFVSSIIVLLEQPVRPGDFIEIDGVNGEVRRIGLRATTLRTVDGLEFIVPNSQLLEQRLTNWTLSSPVVRLRLPFGVAYGSPTDLVRDVALEVASANRSVLQQPSPAIQFVDFGSSSLDFVLLVWISEPWNRFVVLSELRFALERALREAGIEIPFPQRDIHLRSVDPSILERLRQDR